ACARSVTQSVVGSTSAFFPADAPLSPVLLVQTQLPAVKSRPLPLDASMMVIRVAKAALIAAIALSVSLVAFGNLTDYNTNFAFVQHVLSMDTIYPFSTIRYRAITDPVLQRAAYAVIIAVEATVAV